MSSKFFSVLTKNAAALTGKYSKQNGVSTERESFADYLRRLISEKNLRYRQVAERSGGLISHAAISDIISGKTREVKASTITALAKGLGVTEEEVFAAYSGKKPVTDSPEYKNWRYAALFDDSQKLTPEQMTKFETIMEIARREVERMLQEQANESPRKKSKKA